MLVYNIPQKPDTASHKLAHLTYKFWCQWLVHVITSVQSAQIEAWNLYTPLFDQLIQNALME